MSTPLRMSLGSSGRLCVSAGAGGPDGGAEGGGGAARGPGGPGHPEVEPGGAAQAVQSTQQPEPAAAAPGRSQVEIEAKDVGASPSSIGLLTLPWCSARGQRLREVLQLHEFRRESSELRDWMEQQKQIAESQEMGNNYQHIQVLPPPTHQSIITAV